MYLGLQQTLQLENLEVTVYSLKYTNEIIMNVVAEICWSRS